MTDYTRVIINQVNQKDARNYRLSICIISIKAIWSIIVWAYILV